VCKDEYSGGRRGGSVVYNFLVYTFGPIFLFIVEKEVIFLSVVEKAGPRKKGKA
jgi:hypothetical protein